MTAPTEPEATTTPGDSQRMVVDLCLKHCLSGMPDQTMVITHQQMLDLAQFTLRLEIVDIQHPQTSPIKCSLITIAEAERLLQELKKVRRP